MFSTILYNSRNDSAALASLVTWSSPLGRRLKSGPRRSSGRSSAVGWWPRWASSSSQRLLQLGHANIVCSAESLRTGQFQHDALSSCHSWQVLFETVVFWQSLSHMKWQKHYWRGSFNPSPYTRYIARRVHAPFSVAPYLSCQRLMAALDCLGSLGLVASLIIIRFRVFVSRNYNNPCFFKFFFVNFPLKLA